MIMTTLRNVQRTKIKITKIVLVSKLKISSISHENRNNFSQGLFFSNSGGYQIRRRRIFYLKICQLQKYIPTVLTRIKAARI